MDQQEFKAWLKTKLDATGMTAKEFADKAKISKPLVYFYLSGQRVPTEATMQRIADALGAESSEVSHLVRKGLGRPPASKETLSGTQL